MPPPWFHPHRLDLERRFDGPIPSEPSWGEGRAGLFQRMAGQARADLASARRKLEAIHAPADSGLGRGQRSLRSYRDQAVAWSR